MTANNCVAVDHNATAGDDRGGIAVSTNFAYYRGDSNLTRFDITGLTTQTNLPLVSDGILSDLSTGRLYSLASGANTPLTVEPLHGPGERGSTGRARCHHRRRHQHRNAFDGDQRLRQCLLRRDQRYLRGTRFALILTPARVFKIELATGVVTDLAARPATFTATGCENWAFWGIAEFDGSAFKMVYVQNTTTIARTNVTTGVTTTAASFSNLSDMCSISASPTRNRWYFHHEGGSQFFSANENMGYCDATFTQ